MDSGPGGHRFHEMKDLIQPVARKRLSDEVRDQLKALILERNLRPGDRLPPERELSHLFHVGRPSVREAIRSLDILGYLEIRPGHGIFVKEPSPDFFLKTIIESVRISRSLEKRTILELLEVRIILETKIASLTAKNADEKDRMVLQKTFRAFEDALHSEDADLLVNADMDFHKAIARCSHNNVMYVMVGIMEDLSKRTTGEILSLTDFHAYSSRACVEHRRILKAVLEGSEVKAAEAMRRHLMHGRRIIHDVMPGERIPTLAGEKGSPRRDLRPV